MKTPKRAKVFSDYRANVEEWHDNIATNYKRLLTDELADGQCGAFLVWGDPTLYDSTLRIIDKIRAEGFALEYDVIPGISSVQVLAAKHRIALNRIGEPVLITPARKLIEGLSDNVDSTVVVLDGEQTFKRLDGEAFDIYWGAYLGTPDEILVAGKLSEVRSEIETLRESARRANGWIMDTYLLRKRHDE
jgi:precorrin-6A synthase